MWPYKTVLFAQSSVEGYTEDVIVSGTGFKSLFTAWHERVIGVIRIPSSITYETISLPVLAFWGLLVSQFSQWLCLHHILSLAEDDIDLRGDMEIQAWATELVKDKSDGGIGMKVSSVLFSTSIPGPIKQLIKHCSA